MTSRPNPFWTADRLATLKQMWLSGKTSGEIAEHLQVSRAAISGAINRNGLRLHALRAAGINLPHHKGGGQYQRRNRDKAKKAAPAILTITGKPKAAPIPKGTPIPSIPEPVAPLRLNLLELDDTSCRYPIGNSPYVFCGKEVQPGSSYCPDCHRICWRPMPDRKPVSWRARA